MVEDGDSPLQFTHTNSSSDVNMSRWRVRVQYPGWFKEGLRESIIYSDQDGARSMYLLHVRQECYNNIVISVAQLG